MLFMLCISCWFAFFTSENTVQTLLKTIVLEMAAIIVLEEAPQITCKPSTRSHEIPGLSKLLSFFWPPVLFKVLWLLCLYTLFATMLNCATLDILYIALMRCCVCIL